MVRMRNQFHYAVRRVKKMSKSIRARKLLESSEKQIKGSKKDYADLPECVCGVTGETKIVEVFKNVYSELYNSSNTVYQMTELKQLLQSEISDSCLQHARRITGAAVKEAACRMKPGKSDVSTSYTSDALINAPDTFDLLALVFRSWLVHGTVSLSLLACAFLPLFRGGLKDPANNDSYRTIAGSSWE